MNGGGHAGVRRQDGSPLRSVVGLPMLPATAAPVPGAAEKMEPERRLDPNRLGDHLDRLYRAAWALCGSRETAEDLVQDTFARVIARPRFLRSEDDLGYLLRVLRNIFLDQRRKLARQPEPQPLDLNYDHFVERASTQPEKAAEDRLVYGAVAALGPEFRDAVVAVDVLGLSYAEAAKALRVREGTVTSRVFRGRQQVAAQLRAGEVESPGAVSTGSRRRASTRPASAVLRG
jgi:RNA polymerase sigma-70 factor, ECF subfamily